MNRLDSGTDPGQMPKTTNPGQALKTTPTQSKPMAEKAKHIKKQYGRQFVRVKQKIANLWRRATVLHVSLDAEDKPNARPKPRRRGLWNYVLLYLVLVCGAQVLCSEHAPGPDKPGNPSVVKTRYATGGILDNGPDKSGGNVDKPTNPMDDAPGSRPLGDDGTKDPHKESSEFVHHEAKKGAEADSKSRHKRARTCAEGQMPCDGECLPHNKWCDGYPDCDDKADEETCESYYCYGERTKCGGNSHLCVNRKYRCNGVENDTTIPSVPPPCRGTGDDEKNCSTYKCRGDMVACGTGEAKDLCVESRYRCDGEKNNELPFPIEKPVCGGIDGADEEDCAGYTCRGDMVACGGSDSLCVLNKYRCVGEEAEVADAENNENKKCGGTNDAEAGCDGANAYKCRGDQGMIACPDKEHMCMNSRDRCRLNPNVTDIKDMPQPCKGDKSDAKFCNETAIEDGTDKCEDPWKKCNDSKQCYHKKWMCDGVRSCADGTDEDGCEAVAGVAGEWSEWECGVKCGEGNDSIANRVRACDNPKPKFGGNCTEELTETKPCDDLKACPGVKEWADWGPWSDCTNKCGTKKTRERTRECEPVEGGLDCPAYRLKEMETDKCPHCPVDGGWSEWTSWGRCSVTCGVQGTDGKQSRRRGCNNPRPEHGGKNCEGDLSEKKACVELSPCPTVPANENPGLARACTKADEWQCSDGKKCIKKALKCDGNNNCADKSDEAGCSGAPLLHAPGLLMTSMAVMTSLLM